MEGRSLQKSLIGSLVVAVVIVLAVLLVRTPLGDLAVSGDRDSAPEALRAVTIGGLSGEASSTRLEALEASVRNIEKQLAQIDSRLHGLDGTDQRLGDPAVEVAVAAPATFKDREILFEQSMAATSRGDEAWSGQMAIDISAAIARSDHLNQASTHQATCGAAMCAVTVSIPAHMDDFDREFYLDALLMKVGRELPHSVHESRTNPDGSVELNVYLARRGYRLPTADHPLGRKTESATVD